MGLDWGWGLGVGNEVRAGCPHHLEAWCPSQTLGWGLRLGQWGLGLGELQTLNSKPETPTRNPSSSNLGPATCCAVAGCALMGGPGRGGVGCAKDL